MSDAEQEVRALIGRWRDAVLRKDAAAIAAMFADDVILYDAARPLSAQGADPKGTQLWLDSWGDPVRYDLDEVRAIAGDDVAIAFTTGRIGPLKATGDDVRLRLTWGFRRDPDGWRVVLDHSSVPADLATGKANLAAEPA